VLPEVSAEYLTASISRIQDICTLLDPSPVDPPNLPSAKKKHE
jgi:hypothetical protein